MTNVRIIWWKSPGYVQICAEALKQFDFEQVSYLVNVILDSEYIQSIKVIFCPQEINPKFCNDYKLFDEPCS